jgi:transposase InsO family protein
MRGVAYGMGERVLLMKLHEQGRSLKALSRETGVARQLLSEWWKRYRQGGVAAPPFATTAALATTNRGRDAAAHSADLASRAGASTHRAGNRGECGDGVSRVGSTRTPAAAACGSSFDPALREIAARRTAALDLKYLPDLHNPRPEYEFAAIDDYSREAVAQITADRNSRVATDFLEQVLAQLPYRVEAVMTDNDLVFTMRFAFHSDRQTRFQQACRSLGIQHQLIRPHTPASNGKVERFIKTIDDECYAVHRPRSSKTRMRVLEQFLWHYNHERRHLSLGGLTPVQRREAYFAQAQVS